MSTPTPLHLNSKLPLREKLAYGVGDFASDLIFATVSTFLMFYYTDIYGLPAAVVGTLLFVARSVDAVWDIYLGTLVDRTHSRWGQCRPYLLWAAPVLALAAIATFTIPTFTVPSLEHGASYKLGYAHNKNER